MFDQPQRRIRKRQYTSFLSGIPDWLMEIGTVSLSHDESLGRADLTVDNNVGGIALTTDSGGTQQSLSTADFAELRLGCSFSHNLTGENKLNVVFADATGTGVSSAWVIAGEKSDGSSNELLLAEAGNQTSRDIPYNWVSAGGVVRCEVRIRPDDNYVAFALGDADQVVYQEYDAPFGVADFYPIIQIATDNEGTSETVSLDEFWVEASVY